MKRLVTIFFVVMLGSAVLGASAAVAQDFGLEDFDVTYTNADGSPATQAGSHPFAVTTSFDVTSTGEAGGYLLGGAVKDVSVALPPGFVGDTQATPRCPTASFTEFSATTNPPYQPACPIASVVGVAATRYAFLSGGEPNFTPAAIYNLEPPKGMAAMLGFVAEGGVAITIELRVSPSRPYNVIGTVNDIPQPVSVFGSVLTIWGNPSDSAHDPIRGRCLDNTTFTPAPEFRSTGSCPSGTGAQRPFLTLPASCTGPLSSAIEVWPWENPTLGATASSVSHDNSGPPIPLGMGGCQRLSFEPSISAATTTGQAESASGLNFNLDFRDEGLTSPTGIAQSDIKKAVVTLPEGMTLNPSAAEGLSTCSEADLERETVDSEPGQGCPEAAKVGNVEVETPLLQGTVLHGSLYVATPYENPFKSLLAIYMVIKDPQLGILVKLPGEAVPDEKTGQLVTTFGDAPHEVPQFPFSHFNFHFREGPRGPLVTPPSCGNYAARADFTPWANPGSPLATTASFGVTSGIDGHRCPSGTPPFKPSLTAGTLTNSAGTYSPFLMHLMRSDGEQDITRLDAVLPPGVVGKLAGVGKCSDGAIAGARTKTGRQELASPSCPAGSQIGHVVAGAGVGSSLTYVTGSVYLAGPFAGDPLSVVVITPAVAGPFDVGTVVVREALTLDPTTAEVQVDGAQSSIPRILKGIPLRLRDLRVNIDRDKFTLNPTSCDPSQTRATVFAPAASAALSSRFQAASCARLGFKPRLSLRLKGGTKRSKFPALRAVVRPRPDDANIGKAVVTLPHSAFLEQAHIRTICTRVQFAADACPSGSIYGRARAFTPLLDEPLEGPVYLRSSSHPLPDLVAALHGVVDIDLIGRIDSVKGRIRTSFESAPDAPVSKFVLNMQGGKKGLIVNSRNLCAHKSHAIADFTGQNGKPYKFGPLVKASGCKGNHRKR